MNRRRWIVAGVAVLVLLACAPLAWDFWKYNRFSRSFHEKTDGPVTRVSFQANTDWPVEKVTDAKKIDELKSWLLATSAVSSWGKAPADCVCEIRFFFPDGHQEVVQHSPIRERRSDEGWADVRDQVHVFFRGHDRIGPTANLAEILAPAK